MPGTLEERIVILDIYEEGMEEDGHCQYGLGSARCLHSDGREVNLASRLEGTTKQYGVGTS